MPVPSGSGPALGLADVKRRLDIDLNDTSDDAELAWFLTVAIDWVTKKVTDINPTPVREAILELVAHLFTPNRYPGAAGATDDEDTTTGSFDFLTVPRVRELLGPYLPQPAPTGSFPPAQCWPDPPRALPLSTAAWRNW